MQQLQYAECNVRRPRNRVEYVGDWRIEEKPSRFPGQMAFFCYRENDETAVDDEVEGPFFSAVKARMFIAAREALS